MKATRMTGCLAATPAWSGPSTWDIQSEVFAQYHEGRIQYECAISCQAGEGSGLSMDLLLPHNALGLRVNGEDLAGDRLGPRQDGLRPLRIDWRTRDILDRLLASDSEIYLRRPVRPGEAADITKDHGFTPPPTPPCHQPSNQPDKAISWQSQAGR